LDRILLYPVFLPLAVGFALLFLPRRAKPLFKLATVVVSMVAFVLSIQIFRLEKATYNWPILSLGEFRLDLLLTATPLGSFILMFAMGFGVLITLYSLRSRAAVSRTNEYYGSILLAIGGSAGILLTDHLLFLLVFWEIVTASLYVLISTGGKHSNFAATKSFAMIGASDAGFLLGIGMVWTLSGTFVISEIHLPTTSSLQIISFLLLMLVAVTKAGAMPLHTWLPTGGEYAPTSVMALLPAALDKLLGIYLLVLVVTRMFVLQGGPLSIVLAVIGAGTIVIAVMIAMVQHNLKKLLSYHAISQVGYMVLGIATLTPVGIAGGVFHMLNHAIYKSCLFLCGGAVEEATGTAELDELGGLGRKMPLTFAACLIAALSISGIPPLNGFTSKWMVYQGVVQMGTTRTGTEAALWPLWLVAAMFGSALTLASFVKILHSVFLSRLPDRLKGAREVTTLQTFPMLVLAFLCVLFGVFYTLPLYRFILPALGITTDQAIFIGAWNSQLATGLLLVGIGVGMGVLAVSAFHKKVREVPTWTCGEIQPNDEMIIPGTHFYKTISSMNGLRQMYKSQESGYFDLYNQGGRAGLFLTGMLKWMHSGILPVYLTWVTLGLLIVLFVVCGIW
jgi:formate hydrogenlyase subunit 3/multisubunit Na+/H+ antiporter MnhD subunit